MPRTFLVAIALLFLGASEVLAFTDPQPTAPLPPLVPEGADGAASGQQLPDLSPDGRTVYFTLHGDLWRVTADGGDAERLTIHEAADIKPRISPDGSRIAFSSLRQGNYDIFLLPAEGGRPTPVTFDSAQELVSDWSPDGQRILFYSNRDGDYDLYEVSASGGEPRRITYDGAIHGVYSPDGRTIAYVRGTIALNIRGYRGSSNWDLYTVDAAGGTPRRMTLTPWNERDPAFAADGRTIYFAAEDTDHYGLWRIPVEGGTAEKVVDLPGDVSWMRIARNGLSIVFQRFYAIYLLDLQLGTERPVPIATRTDDRGYTRETRNLTDGAEDPAFSADGTQIAFTLRGDIWVMPASGGAARQFTAGTGTDRWPRFSPDGHWISFFSNRSGNNDIWVMPAEGGAPRAITNNPADDFYQSWAPDSHRIIFASERSGNRDIWETDIDGGAARQLTTTDGPDDDPVYSPDGQWIAWDSARSGNQDLWIMRADGSDARRVTRHPDQDQVPDWSPDGRFLCFDAYRDSQRAAWVIDVKTGREMMLSQGGALPRWSPRGDAIVFEAEREGSTGIFRAPAPREVLVGEPISFVATVTVDERQEFLQVFDEAWNALRDGFYDPNLHGVDWSAIRDRYRPLVEAAEVRDEVYDIIRAMIGELKSSHMGLTGPVGTEVPRVRTGYLGLELVPAPAGPGMLVRSVVPGGPADGAWIRPGDRVFAVAGQDLSPASPLAIVLNGHVREEVEVVVGPTESRADARTISVRTAAAQDIMQAEYTHWVEGRRSLVRERSGGRLAYVHLDAMDQENLARFRQAVADAQDAAGLVLDVRNNGGGSIHQDLIDILTRRPYVYFDPRTGDRRLQQSPCWAKPVILLINERSFSDAEIFPYGFRTLGLGHVVGVPTAGGVIGTGSVTLVDGSVLRMPSTGWYGLGGENLEGLGVEPDVVVEETPEDRAAGRDPQLERAIELLLAEIDGASAPQAPAPPQGPEVDEY